MLKRLLPLLLFATVLILFFAFDLDRYFTIESIREHHAALQLWVQHSPWVAALSYVVLYIVIVLFSLPGGLMMTITGGILFGAVAGGAYALIGATIGATAIFLVAKTSLGDYLLAKAGDSMKRMQQGFSDNAMSYLFVLRLVPLFPFFLVNLVPAFLGVSLRVYVIATLFGMMPATFVFTLTGAGLSSVLEQGGEISLQHLLTPEMVMALVGLACLALIPVLYKFYQKGDLKGGEA